MSTSAELEVLKEKIRQMPASSKRGSEQYNALLLWIPLQTNEDWLRLIKDKDGKLNGVEVAAEICATRNIWKTQRFREQLGEMNQLVEDKKLIKEIRPYAVQRQEDNDVANIIPGNSNTSPVRGEGNPLVELAELRLKTQLKRSEEKLHAANIRIKHLEKRLKKYEDLSELNRALDQLRKQRK